MFIHAGFYSRQDLLQLRLRLGRNHLNGVDSRLKNRSKMASKTDWAVHTAYKPDQVRLRDWWDFGSEWDLADGNRVPAGGVSVARTQPRASS